MTEQQESKGWTVTFCGMGVNLALGILYAWSVIKGGIPDSWGWSNADKALPYSVACLIFALAMVPAGRLQDKIGPRWVSTIGGILVGVGFIIAALAGSSLAGFVAGFGVLAGTGIGFGYASATPPAVKWFPPQKTGLIAGLVVAGFGLASVYIAPLATQLLSSFGTVITKTDPAGAVKQVVEKGVSSTMLVFGIAFLVIVVILSQWLKDPPKGYVPAGTPAKGSAAAKASVDRGWKEMLSTGQFYILWLIYFAGASAGLTFISVAQDLGKKSLGELAFVAVAVLAVGNASGRIVAGIISDKMGRQWTMFGFLILQAIVLFVLYLLKGGAEWPIVLLIVLLIGANYGSNLSLFPSATKDYFGLKNFGVNYGFVFTAWGIAGLIMPWVNGRIKDATGSDTLTFFIIIAVLIIAALLTFVSRSIAARDAALAKA
ncbi:MAG TPA: OFA family MFS transporter [Syntrophorhabdales bacterium]|nr:OFA family MFS transporter [Syntrophorhabdales bacterium]